MAAKPKYPPCPAKKVGKCTGPGHLTKASFTPGGKQRWRCVMGTEDGKKHVCYQTTDPTAPYRDQGARAREVQKPKRFRRALGHAHRVVVTWAQNGTPIHEGFFKSLLAYCEGNEAELVVIPGRYKNPTSQWTQAQANAESWADELHPYLYDGRKKLNNNLTLVGDVKIIPTTMTPLASAEGMTHVQSSIFGHPRVQLTTVATPQSKLPKIMTTTGAVTQRNYTDSRQGKLGEFHHVFGAALVEIQSPSVFHLTQINARKDGAFCVLSREGWHAYYPDGTYERLPGCPALVLGDSHVQFRDRSVERATFWEGGLVECANPETLVFHDVLDAYANNPHHRGNPFIAVAKNRAGYDDVRAEVVATIEWLNKVCKGREGIIVPANHDDMLARWMQWADWRVDPKNAEFYLETALQMVRSARLNEQGAEYLDPFGYWVGQLAAANIRALKRNESFVKEDIEFSLHGHEGPGGARGTMKNLAKIGVKLITGHEHAPGIEGPHFKVGTSGPLHPEYAGPVSRSLHTHCTVDPFGKRHLHNIIEGSFSLD